MPSSPSPSERLAQARDAIARGDLEGACATLEPITHSDVHTIQVASPKRPVDFWRDAADAMRDAGLSEEAAHAWQRARSAGLAPSVAQTQTAATWLAAGRFDAALEILETLHAADPKSAIVGNLRAIALLENGRAPEAAEAWRATLKRSAQSACPLSTHPLYLALAAIALERYLALGAAEPRDEEALPSESEAPRRAPGGTLDARWRSIERAAGQGQWTTALGWIETEINKAKKPTEEMRLMRAWALAELERWAEARAEVLAIVAAADAPPAAVSFYARCLARSGEPGVALGILESVAPAGPDDFFVHYNQGCARLALGDRPRALLAFRIAFTEFFYDSYHSILVPTWNKAMRRMVP